jgi:hypothetical protein
MRFRKGNKIKFRCNYSERVGIPHGVDFTAKKSDTFDGEFTLRMRGCGFIYLHVWGLTAKQRKRFEENLT